MSSFVIKILDKYIEAEFLGDEQTINGITHYSVNTPFGQTYVNTDNIFLKVKELKHWNS